MRDEADDIQRAGELYCILVDMAAREPPESYVRRALADIAVAIIKKIDETRESTNDN